MLSNFGLFEEIKGGLYDIFGSICQGYGHWVCPRNTEGSRGCLLDLSFKVLQRLLTGGSSGTITLIGRSSRGGTGSI